MSVYRQVVLGAGAALVLLAVLYVPWIYTFDYEAVHSENPAGYHSIFSPPTDHPRKQHTGAGVRVNYSQVAATVTAIMIAAGAVFCLMPRSRP